MQSLVVSGLLKIAKVGGAENVADLGTKYVDKTTLARLRELVGVLPELQTHNLVQLIVCGQLFERPDQSPPSQHRPPLPTSDQQLPQDHNALCHYALPLCLQLSHYRERSVCTSSQACALGNYNVNAAQVPLGLLRGGEQPFYYYLGLCRISFYSRVLRAGCHARTTNAVQMFYTKNKKVTDYIMEYLVDEDYTCVKTVDHALDYKLKMVNYFEHDYPEGLVNFVRWVTKVYDMMFMNYMSTNSDPLWGLENTRSCMENYHGNYDAEEF